MHIKSRPISERISLFLFLLECACMPGKYIFTYMSMYINLWRSEVVFEPLSLPVFTINIEAKSHLNPKFIDLASLASQQGILHLQRTRRIDRPPTSWCCEYEPLSHLSILLKEFLNLFKWLRIEPRLLMYAMQAHRCWVICLALFFLYLCWDSTVQDGFKLTM